MTSPFRCLAALLILVFSTQLQAAPVFNFTKITAETDVLNSGTILRASNFGYGPQGTFDPVTVNGVSFDTDTTGLSGMTAGGGDFNTEFAGGSPLDELLSGTWFQTGGTSSLMLTGLTAGEDYIYQMFLSNMVNSTGWNSQVSLQGSAVNLGTLGYAAAGGTAHILQIDFTATGSSEVVSFGTGSSSQSARMQFNGFSLQTASTSVPTPGALALLALGLVAIRLKRG